MRILLAVDDSPHSAAALHSVESRPWPPDTVVRVLCAVPRLVPPASEPGYDAAEGMAPLVEEAHRHATAFTARVADELRQRSIQAEAIVRDGDPRLVIVDEARDWHADLVLVGSHGRTGLSRWLLGSVAQFVVSHAPCSVEIVRAHPTASAA